MQQEDNNMDHILRKLENESLPDLSHMDKHWEGMQLLLAPGPQEARRNNPLTKNKWGILFAVMVMAVSTILMFNYLIQASSYDSPSVKEQAKDSLSLNSNNSFNNEPRIINQETKKDSISRSNPFTKTVLKTSSSNIQHRKPEAITGRSNPAHINQDVVNDTFNTGMNFGTTIAQILYWEQDSNTIVTFRQKNMSESNVEAIIVTNKEDTLKLIYTIQGKDSLITKEILDNIRTKIDSINAIKGGN